MWRKRYSNINMCAVCCRLTLELRKWCRQSQVRIHIHFVFREYTAMYAPPQWMRESEQRYYVGVWVNQRQFASWVFGWWWWCVSRARDVWNKYSAAAAGREFSKRYRNLTTGCATEASLICSQLSDRSDQKQIHPTEQFPCRANYIYLKNHYTFPRQKCP